MSRLQQTQPGYLPTGKAGICIYIYTSDICQAESCCPPTTFSCIPSGQTRYSSNEAQLTELISHAALAEQRLARAATGTVTASPRGGANRRRSDPTSREAPTVSGRSPLEAIERLSRDDPDWAAVHHRQAWFLQVL